LPKDVKQAIDHYLKLDAGRRPDAQLPWITHISANLLRDEELVDLIAASGCNGYSSAWNLSTMSTLPT
jgi:hypothetical protein